MFTIPLNTSAFSFSFDQPLLPYIAFAKSSLGFACESNLEILTHYITTCVKYLLISHLQPCNLTHPYFSDICFQQMQSYLSPG